MEIFRTEEYIKMQNPTPGIHFMQRILTNQQKAKDTGGIFAVLAPGAQRPYHYHDKRESIIIALSGEATEIVEGEEIPIKANEVLYIPAREKHAIDNRTDKEFRYFEFFTYPEEAPTRL